MKKVKSQKSNPDSYNQRQKSHNCHNHALRLHDRKKPTFIDLKVSHANEKGMSVFIVATAFWATMLPCCAKVRKSEAFGIAEWVEFTTTG